MATITTAQNTVSEAVKPSAIATDTPLSVRLANMLSAVKTGDRYVVAGRKTPVIAGVLAVYNTSIYDSTDKVYYDVIAVKPLSKGRAIVLGQMTDRGLDLCPRVRLNAEILTAVARANSSWAEMLKVEAKQTRLNLKLDAIAEYFSVENGAFVDL